ncbi:MAG: cell division protein FtsH, partial [Gammaproteobacteria bacterium]|nr:cell division protein FtsH [Gammaproteobacteria bacterium]
RIAEEIFMQQMTTGAANDFERATEMARNMVARWGMSDRLGTRTYGENQSEVFLGRDVTTHQNLSDATAEIVDEEIRRIIDEQYQRARKILEDNREKVEIMTGALLEWETLESDQIDAIMRGEKPRSPEDGRPADGAGPSPDEKPRKPRIKPRMDSPAGEH